MEVTIIRKVTLSMDEQKKYEIIKALADHPAPNKQRVTITLGCTVRHVNRLLKGYREHGKSYFIHGNRGRKPSNTIPTKTRNLVVDLYLTKYHGANFEYFTELLGKYENIHISSSAVMFILEAKYIFSPDVFPNCNKSIHFRLPSLIGIFATMSSSKYQSSIKTSYMNLSFSNFYHFQNMVNITISCIL